MDEQEASVRLCIEAFLARAPTAGGTGGFDLAWRVDLLDHLAARGLRIESFTESEYMSFALSQHGDQWTLQVNEFDERVGPYQRRLVFDSRRAAHLAVLDVVLPTMRNYGAGMARRIETPGMARPK